MQLCEKLVPPSPFLREYKTYIELSASHIEEGEGGQGDEGETAILLSMLFSWRQSSVPSPYRGGGFFGRGGGLFGSSLLVNGLLCILFGVVILMEPELLAYIVAVFFVLLGAMLLSAWWKMRR